MTAIKINAQVICRIAGIPGIFTSHAFFYSLACLARGYHAAIIFSTASTSLHLDLAAAAAPFSLRHLIVVFERMESPSDIDIDHDDATTTTTTTVPGRRAPAPAPARRRFVAIVVCGAGR